MTARSKVIGNRWESKVLGLYVNAGFTNAKKTYQPAQSAGLDPGDINVNGLKIEVKYRRTGTGYKTLRKWIDKKDHLVLCEPYLDPLVVLRFEDYVKLLGASNDQQSGTMGQGLQDKS
jgi:hypothetical protein